MADDALTTLFLIRHGHTLRAGYCNGHLDVDLTPTGIGQMEEIGKRLAGDGIRALYASDLKRCVQGAEVIGRALALKPVLSSRLREKQFGAWEGLPREEIQRRFPGEWEEWTTNPADAKPTGGESYREVSVRVMAQLREILERHIGEKVAMLSHGGVNRVILCHVLDLELKHLARIEQRYAALNLIDFYKNDAVVRLING